MALSQRLEVRQTQGLVMTPQLMQAIKLLQLSSLDLAAYVEGELERNPLLERASDDDGPAAEPAEAAESRDEPSPSDWTGDELETSRSAMEQGLGTELENVFPDDAAPRQAQPEAQQPAYSEWSGVGAGGSDGDNNLEAYVSSETTLAAHLAEQMTLAIADPVRRMIGQYLIDMVDEAGYLTGDLASVAEKLGAPISEVEAVLAILQKFDPAGICARNLTECLAIQLRDRDRLDPAMQVLLAHLELLAKRDLGALRRICGVDDEDLVDMIAEIRALNPKPGLAFDTTSAQPIVPDVLVRPQGAGWTVELNNDTLPRVLVNNRYYAEISSAARSKAEKDYLVDRYQQANWLAKALHQRATTILKVSTEIVRQQEGFFRHGVRHLRPLVLRDIAEAIGMHESTVSRVTSGKYMATPRGIYELKYFFTAAIAATSGGAALSAEAVRFRIKALIDAEAADVLSDDRIVEILLAEGIDIARRTVAKYREAMHIPSSVQRRRDRALPL